MHMSISLTDNNKIFGSEPRSYEYNRFPDKYTRYRFYSSEKRPLSIKTQNLIKNEYCSQCGTLISNVDNLHECFACKKPLCLSCNNAGLCVSHFQQLDKDDQQTLKKHSKRKQKSF